MANIQYTEEFAFYQQLKFYYDSNRGKIRSRYNDLTKKFLAYNDKSENPDAFLRLPQFEALEMYVFIKEFMGNPQVYELFDDWRNRRDKFSDASYYSVRKGGQIRIFDNESEIVTDTLFKQMKKYKEAYPNYIYALTMGLGKTILMATCIFYEFLLANKYPKDKRFCHNALVFAPDKTVLQFRIVDQRSQFLLVFCRQCIAKHIINLSSDRPRPVFQYMCKCLVFPVNIRQKMFRSFRQI